MAEPVKPEIVAEPAPPPPSEIVPVPAAPAPPPEFGLDDALTLLQDGDDELVAELAREAARMLRRRLDRALDDGGAPSRLLVRALQAIAAEIAPDGEALGDNMAEIVPLSSRRGATRRR
jgi:hypothetical protein